MTGWAWVFHRKMQCGRVAPPIAPPPRALLTYSTTVPSTLPSLSSWPYRGLVLNPSNNLDVELVQSGHAQPGELF